MKASSEILTIVNKYAETQPEVKEDIERVTELLFDLFAGVIDAFTAALKERKVSSKVTSNGN